MNGTITLSEFQVDALKEFGNIGSAHAATSLSMMIGRDIEMQVPEIEIAPLAAIGQFINPDEPVAGLYFQLMSLESSNNGHIYLLFPEKSALSISDMLMSLEIGTTREITETEQSALMEVGNVLISSFGDASAELLGMTMLPSPPTYRHDMACRLIEEIAAEVGRSSANVIIFKAALSDAARHVNGYLLLLPEPQTLENILTLLGAKVNG
jgi:chemotaxis protein CheC